MTGEYCDHDFIRQEDGTFVCWKCGTRGFERFEPDNKTNLGDPAPSESSMPPGSYFSLGGGR